MSKGRMRLRYHPVLKEMQFERYENGGWVRAGDVNSILYQYVTGKDLLLQNLGPSFFQDIISSMDNIREITLDFVGTREDYEDLKSMVEYYQNTRSDGRGAISIGELAELSSVRELFDDVMAYSDQTSDAFRRMVRDVQENNEKKGAPDRAKENEVDSICAALEAWLENLDRKREGLAENAVNLCFVGAYSSGKSTLISALIGESILPEAIKSETAKMFKITQIPRDSGELPSVSFCLAEEGAGYEVSIEWDGEGKASLRGWPHENPIREAVQCALNETEGKRRHIQVKTVLSRINTQPGTPESLDEEGNLVRHSSYVDGIVSVRYPFDLKSGVLFHIYDTPGTDSNNPEHLRTLKAALEDPKSSILVYVNDTKLEGNANATLLSILEGKESGRLADGSTIDLSRSFFVINRADTVKDERALLDLRDGSLRLDRAAKGGGSPEEPEGRGEGILEIKLKEKRLFFTDALHAGDARAMEKGLAGDDEKQRLKDNTKLVNTPWYHLYQYDVMAQAEADTKRLIEDADGARKRLMDGVEEALRWKEAFDRIVMEDPDAAPGFLKDHPRPEALRDIAGGLPMEAYYICSGVYSLQKEIERYAERFALAVRAKGVIDGTRDLIRSLDKRCVQAKNTLDANITDLDRQISTVKNELTDKIDKLCGKYRRDDITEDEARYLGLDPKSAGKRKKLLEKSLEKIVRDYLMIGSKKPASVEKHANREVQNAADEFFNGYIEKYKKCLESMQRSLIDEIKREIEARRDLDQGTKERLKNIQEQKIEKQSRNMADIQIQKYRKKFLFISWIDRDRFIDELITEFERQQGILREDYKTQYSRVRNELVKAIRGQYQARVDEFAGEIIRLKRDRDGFKEELGKLESLLEDVQARDKKLEEKIYKQIQREG